ncbi:MAG: dethiobiotin synthase [Gammaproteobacteria bacterium]|nr:MAG: dethiobiotin synthase [Gammaproteobacteria bacterium]
MKNYFITATDTDAGKTFVACALIQALIKRGKKVTAYKPIAAGCQQVGEQLINEDAQLLSQFANCNQNISEVNPISLVEAIAPHIAAAKINRELCVEDVTQGFAQVLSIGADINITEGAGGWRLPLNLNVGKAEFLSDFVIHTKQDVILVVNMKLGCLNHALLTYQAIIADGLRCVAWIANNASEESMSHFDENIASLEQLLPIPKMAQLEFYSDATMSLHDKICAAANEIDCNSLL